MARPPKVTPQPAAPIPPAGGDPTPKKKPAKKAAAK